jgi:hypothetical protein
MVPGEMVGELDPGGEGAATAVLRAGVRVAGRLVLPPRLTVRQLSTAQPTRHVC